MENQLWYDDTVADIEMPMSFAQQRLWLIDQMEPGTALYNMPLVMRLIGKLNVQALEASYQEIIFRHESLRTVFAEYDGELFQVIKEARPLPLRQMDIRGAEDVEAEMQALAAQERSRPFDLKKGPLSRLLLLKTGEEEHVLVLTLHHIISDGWSQNVLIQELGALYQAFASGRPSPLPELPIQYADFAYWQLDTLQGEVLEEKMAYWRQKLGGDRSVLLLPTDFPRPAVQTHRGRQFHFKLPEGVHDRLMAVGRRAGATSYMVYLAAFNVLLSRYSGQTDLLVGTPTFGRNNAQLDPLIGFFVNTLVMRTDLSGNLTFSELLQQVKETALDAFAHEDVPFEMLVADLQPERNMSHSPLFQVMFAVQNTPSNRLELEGITFQTVPVELEEAKFDLTLLMQEWEEHMHATFEYNADLFAEATMLRMSEHFQQLLVAIAEQPERQIAALPILTSEEQHQLLVKWNLTDTELPALPVHALFEQQAVRTPDKTALLLEGGRISYRELNERANRLARYLQHIGIGPGQLVGLAMERSVELYVAILAIVKAGGAYVPFDTSYPAERLSHMLADTGVTAVVSIGRLADSLPAHDARMVCLDDAAILREIEGQSGCDLSLHAAPDSVAYVMYTSGTTGKPKGILIPHRGIVRLAYGPTAAMPVTEDDVLFQYAPISFDASTLEIWGALLNGATLFVYPPYQASVEEIGQAVQEHGVTELFVTAGLFHQIVDTALDGLRGLRLLASGGDAISAPHAIKVVEQLGIPFFNLYGPTEVTTAATAYEVSAADDAGLSLPIGRPISNTIVYVLDSLMQPMPIGVTGELYVGGEGVALGYLNLPELTAEKFVPSPFRPGERLYRTGDLARWLPSGTLEFMGRIDQQVKIRGYRIEVAEVEAVLDQHPAVRRSVVMVREDAPGVKRLVAYVILDPDAGASTADVRAFLQEQLPGYMVPGAIAAMEEFPLNANQKVDYRALPAPESGLDPEAEYVAPRSDTEGKVALLFAELLGLEQVGANGHFFDLGGHSLLAARLVSRIRDAFAAELPLRSVFEHPTVAGLAKLVTGEEPGITAVQMPPLVQAERGGAIPLSYAQQRLWFLDQLTPGSSAYNIPAALKLHGVLNADAVRQSFQEIVRRHESLRTTFQEDGEQVIQVIAPDAAFDVQQIDLSTHPEREAELRRLADADAAAPFNLQQGPLLRATLVRLGDEEHALLVNMHHIISDGWSMGVLIREFAALYGAFSERLPSPLGDLPVQFADYAIWQRGWMQGDVLREQLDYWKTKLSGELPVLELPTDRSAEPNQAQSAKEVVLLSENLTRQLKKLSLEEGASPFMTLLAAFKLLLARLSGQDDIIVGTPIAGRGLVETEGLIGMLLNTLALRTDLSGAPTFRDLLGRVRETALEAFARQEVPFEKIVEEIQPDRNLDRNPVFDVMINFINTPDSELTLPGLTISGMDGDRDPASKFLMTLYISEVNDQFHLNLVYLAEQFSPARMGTFMEQFQTLLEQVADNADCEITAYPLLTPAVRAILPDPSLPIDESSYPLVGELFAKWAACAPEQPAVVQGEQVWTYQELHDWAGELARLLAASGVQRGDAVAIIGTRSFGVVAAMLGVLNSGGVLVPVDAQLPYDRQQVMVEQSQAKYLLAVGDAVHAADWAAFDIMYIDGSTGRTFEKSVPADTVLPQLSPNDPAYIFFTSGTTGMPKGVLGTHQGLSHFLNWQREQFAVGPQDRIAHLTNLSFDVVLRDIFLPLTSGATLCLPDATDDWSADAILPWLEREGISILHTVPSLASTWLSDLPQGVSLRALRLLFPAGEPLTDVFVQKWRAEFPASGQIVNLYGPTETTLAKCFYVVPQELQAGIQPVGQALPQTQALVLSAAGQLAGIGEGGEIVLRTPFRTLGYLNAPEEHKSFKQNPFRPHDRDDLLYFTGDKGRYRQDGSLEILGRADDQVKVRGVRVHLQEVAATLLRHDAVDACTVLDWKNQAGQVELAAYIVQKPGGQATEMDLRTYLQSRLLAAMVPGTFVFLDELPRLANGKVNRKALPEPKRTSGSEVGFAAPRNPIEEKVAGFFAEVLKVERVGIHDNFFSLGGHSLIAAQLVSRIRRGLQVELPLRMLFERPTVAALAEGIVQQQGSVRPAPPLVATTGRRSAMSPASYAQQRLWFLDQLTPGSNAYNMPIALMLHGELNVDAATRSFNELARRHESLRTTLRVVDEQVMQVVAPHEEMNVQFYDLSEREDRSEQLRVLAEEDALRPFDLAQGPLLRTTLVRMAAQEHALLINMHHIISDAWSSSVLTREFLALYAAFSQGMPSPLPELPLQFADFSNWQREWLQGDTLAEQLSYWKTKLGGDLPVLELPMDREAEAKQSARSGHCTVLLSETLTAEVKALSLQEQATPYMTLLTAFKTLLARLSGQEDIIVGTPVANRGMVETEGMIGLFLNSVAMRTDLSGAPTFRELLGRVRETTLEAYACQEVPFEKIVQEIQPDRNLHRNPVFDIMINFVNTPSTRDLSIPGLTIAAVQQEEDPASKFLMTLYITEQDERLLLRLVYQAERFSEERMDVFMQQFEFLLQQALADADCAIGAYSLRTDETRQHLPDLSISLETLQYPFVRELFETWASDTPDQTAVAQGEQQWSYADLRERAHELARELAANGVRRGEAVAVAGSRSYGLVVSMLAVLFSGGVLVPVDRHLPLARQQLMVEQSNAQHLLLISGEEMPNDWHSVFRNFDIVKVDPQTGSSSDRSGSVGTTLPELSPDDPAYIFFTSGTTGLPKGVLGTHKGLNHFLDWQRKTFDIGPSDRVAQLIHLSFDAVLRDVFLPLTSGATLCLPDELDDLGGDVILPWLEQTGVTVLHTVPSVAQAWAADHPDGITLRSLRHLFLAGEPLTDVLVRRLRNAFPELGEIINLYGPTETTMVKCFYVVPEQPVAGIQPAGVAFPQTQALVWNANGQLAGIGESGEIVLRTPFRTLGYINAPEENKQFQPNPFRPHDTSDLLYFTGDKGRYRPDGSLEILGRMDDQVKVRGVRVQLQEVAATLLRHDAVDACAVIDWKDESGQTELAAYSVLKTGQDATAVDLRAHLGRYLPAAVVPGIYLFLDELPRLANGKINRKALPKPERGRGNEDSFLAPRNEVEEKLAGIFCEVLKLDGVGVHDNFFTLGGHSLKATQVVSRIRQRFAAELPLSSLFERPTVAALAAEMERYQQGQAPGAQTGKPIAPAPRDAATRLPLSFAQQRLWFLDQLDPGSIAYNIPYAVRISGALDTAALERTIDEIVARHEVLRTNFHTAAGQPVQVIAAERAQALLHLDLQHMPAAERDAQIDELAAREVNTPFDLATDALLRAVLIKLGQAEHVLLLTFHHIIADGWSFGVFGRELTAIYTAFQKGLPSPFAELPIQYADFAVWQREHLQGASKEALLAYWKQQFTGDIPVLDLPADRPRPAVQRFDGDMVSFQLPGSLRDALLDLSQREGATLYMTLLAAFNTLLSRYSGQEDIVLGAPVAARNRAEIEPLIGFFVNTLALRTDLSGNPSFRSLLQRVRATALGAFAHQDLPLEMLIDELGMKRDLSRSPLFQVAFLLQNTPEAESLQSDLTLTPLESNRIASKFELTLMVTESGQGLTGKFEYRTDLFDRTTIERMAAHFSQLLAVITENPDTAIAALPLMTPQEEQMILQEWNSTMGNYPEYTFLHSLFEEQAERTPDDLAVRFNEQTLTYRELNEKANQLAHRLQKQGLQEEQLVAILMDRSPELIIAILGVQKAGGAYVPLDPSVPAERLRYMLSDSGASLLLTQERHLTALPEHRAEVIAVDAEWSKIAGESRENLYLDLAPLQLAYVIYTSGSTGRPKGVLLHHYGACHAVSHHAELRQIGTGRRMLQFASPSFDASVMEIFTALTSGATLVLATQEQLMPGAGLSELIRERGITDVTLTPSVLALLPEHDLPSLQTVVSAGEVCPAELAARWIKPGRTFINAYGPTEATIEATVSVNPDASRTPDIGRPIANCDVYILDRHLQPVPVGVPGELHIGGPGVARGYHNRPDLTETAFIPHPYHIDPEERLYKSGDLARWLPDGRIEYLGRLDHQVKIRGFRVETGEIEAALTRHPQVEKAVVVPHTDKRGQKRLAAYYVGTGGTEVTPQELRTTLQQSLPDYMVPSCFLQLDILPLNASGKVDRSALPEPDANSLGGREYLPPQTATEQTLALLWQELLGREQISCDDNFFEIGGHSLLATQVASRVRETFRVELPLRALFEAPTLETLAVRIDHMQPGVAAGPELSAFTGASTEVAPLSFAQQRLWFIDQLEPGSSAYNIANLLRLDGPLDLEALQQSLAELVNRHESLRTVFTSRDGEPEQRVLEELQLPLLITDLQSRADEAAHALQAAHAEAQRPFDLEHGPLVRLHVYKLGEKEHLLLLLMHHIISDGWSMSVFIRELAALYDAIRQGRPSPLAKLPIQYAGYSRWQRQLFAGEAMQQQLGYWKNQLGGELPVLELPTDRPRPVAATANAAKCAFALPSPLTDALRELSRQQGATLYMTLLAAFQTLLSRYSGQQDIVVGSPIAGRNRKEIEGLIGFFINTLVLRTDLSGNPGFAELLQRVKHTTLDAYANQDVPFEMLVAELQPDRELGRTPLFQALFVLQNTPSAGMELPGLTLTGVPLENSTAKFDLSLMMAETEAGLQGSFEYNTDLWDTATIERMAGHFTTLLEGLTNDPAQPVGILPMLTAAEADQLLIEWNETETDYPRDLTVHELVEQFAAMTPDAAALSFEKVTLSYRELNEQANRLARRLQKLGVERGGLVGISMERSTELIVAMLAILKAGAAFVPFDVTYPQDRLLYMFEDTQVGVLLTQERLSGQLPQHGAVSIYVDTDVTLAEESGDNLAAAVSKDDAAYVMYTSGSTGRPKGVVVPHRGIVRLVREVGYTEFTADDIFLQFSPIAFDVSVFEIWGALLNGGKLAIFPPHQATLADLGAVIEQHGVTVLWITTGLFHSMVEHHPEGLRNLRQVLTGGDVLSVPHAQKAFTHFDGRLFNAYGPTENTTFTTCYEVTDPSRIGTSVPIGAPVANTTVYVLDRNGQPVPIGVPGELYTGGDGLALGYLKRPELTSEKFVANPFGDGKLYRTGDAVRWMPNGELEFIGRIDNQVKIRGFRVEIGEIEAALAQHPSVRDTVVVVRVEAGDKRLAAYVTAEGDAELSAAELAGYLKQTLPDHMIPAAFVLLDELPLNPNGKVDRKALAARAITFERLEAYAAPQDRFELELVQIWSGMLGHGEFGVTDSFFSVGGHSLLAVRLVAQIEKKFGHKLPLSVFFREGTIRSLAARLRQGGQELPATPLVTIQPGLPDAAVQPLFLIHPVGGSAFAYFDLARALGAEQPVYGLQARGLDDLGAPLATMEEMAAEYIAAIRTVQQTGPYRLGGWSIGGAIAYETARQLRALGEAVELLALIDTRAPLAAYQREMDSRDLLLAFARDLAGQHGLDLERLPQIDLSPSEESLSALLDLAHQHQVLSSDLELQDLKRLLSVFSSNYLAFNRYVPERSAEHLLLIQADNAESGEYGWSELADEVEIHRIGGNHFTMLQAPHVQELGRILQRKLLTIKTT
ncbi:non-ribosomal peptide synthetase [Tumebacillus avium]|nr:non-ribosomal peptide synthetase [Tumebacillus avium]